MNPFANMKQIPVDDMALVLLLLLVCIMTMCDSSVIIMIEV